MRTKRFQPIERKPVVRCFLTRDARRSIVDMLMIHFRGVRSTARAHGIPEAEVETILIEELMKQKEEAYRRGFSTGRLSLMPPPTERRVA